jgi:hypothetical protein
VTSNSRKIILNVLRDVHETIQRTEGDIRLVKVGRPEDAPLIESGAIEHVEKNKNGAGVLERGPFVMKETA